MGLAERANVERCDDRAKDAEGNKICNTCGGPCGGKLSCTGCWERFENPGYSKLTGVSDDTKEAKIWHAAGGRPSEQEGVAVGQAWLFEPHPGEQSVWIVKEIEDDELGRRVRMRKYYPLSAGTEDDWYARSMVEDKEGGWLFLRHPYPPPFGLVIAQPEAREPLTYLPLRVENYEISALARPVGDRYSVGDVFMITRSIDEENLKKDELVRVTNVRADAQRVQVIHADETTITQHGFGLDYVAARMRPRRYEYLGTKYVLSGNKPTTDIGQVWRMNSAGFNVPKWAPFTVIDKTNASNWTISNGKVKDTTIGPQVANVATLMVPLEEPVDAPSPGKPKQVAEGQRWQVTQDSEGHAAGEVLTIVAIKSPPSNGIVTDACKGHGSHGGCYFLEEDNWGHCKYLGTVDEVVSAPKPAEALPVARDGRVLRWKKGEKRRGPVYSRDAGGVRDYGVGHSADGASEYVLAKALPADDGCADRYDWMTEQGYYVCEDWPSLLLATPEGKAVSPPKWKDGERRAVYVPQDYEGSANADQFQGQVFIGKVSSADDMPARACLNLEAGGKEHLCALPYTTPSCLITEAVESPALAQVAVTLSTDSAAASSASTIFIKGA